MRHQLVRAWLYQRITGNSLDYAPAPFTITNSHDRRQVNDLPRHLHRGLRDALEEHAQLCLQRHGISEPTVWHPPTDIAPPNLPQPPNVDVSRLHAMTRSSIPVGRIAKDLGTALAHARVLLDEHPPPNRP